jgi:predicted transcriptional regulator
MLSNSKTLNLKILKSFSYRSRLDIIYQILSICSKDPVYLTKIRYELLLGCPQLKKYINTLTEKNLLREVIHKGKRRYHSTLRGQQFIKTYRELSLYLGLEYPQTLSYLAS